jgi:hypothetical protein
MKYRLTETLDIELIVELPEGISGQERDALLALWKQSIQVGVEDSAGRSLLGDPCLKSLIYVPVCGKSRCEGIGSGMQVELSVQN